jgi:type VI protein secretion system component VasF
MRNNVGADFEGHSLEHQQQREERYARLEHMAATLRGRVTQLEKIVQQQNTEKVRVEARLRGRVTQLEKIVEQQNVEKVQVEATHRGRITELEEELALT